MELASILQRKKRDLQLIFTLVCLGPTSMPIPSLVLPQYSKSPLDSVWVTQSLKDVDGRQGMFSHLRWMLKSLSEEKGQDVTSASNFTMKFHKLYSTPLSKRYSQNWGAQRHNTAWSFGLQADLKIMIIHPKLRDPSFLAFDVFYFLVVGIYSFRHGHSVDLFWLWFVQAHL